MKKALSMAVVFNYVTLLLGGYYTTTIPTWLEWAKYISHTTYAYNIFLRIEFQHAASSFRYAYVTLFNSLFKMLTSSVIQVT